MADRDPPDLPPEDQGPRVFAFRRDGNGAADVVPPSLGVFSLGTGLPPPRGWLLGTSFCRRFLSSLIGDGGVGKTAIRYAQALSMALGRALTGEHVFMRARVLIVSLEDDADELRRRILALCLHHGIAPGELDGWLFLAAPGGSAGKIMILDQKGTPRRGRFADALESAVVEHHIDVVMVDPFVKAHGLEENANSMIDEVMQILSDLAAKHDLSVDLSHHVSKGLSDPGNANRARGASSMVNAARLVHSATAMNTDEAAMFNIPEEQRRLYVRVDPAKLNIAPSAAAAQWFKLISVNLDNASDLYPNGDSVQAVAPWSPPEMWDRIDADLIARMLKDIGEGCGDGLFYTDSRNADRQAWRVVQTHAPHKSEKSCKQIIKTWVENGILKPFSYINPETRKSVTGLKPNAP